MDFMGEVGGGGYLKTCAANRAFALRFGGATLFVMINK